MKLISNLMDVSISKTSAEENPKETTEISLHSERVTVWSGINEHRIIGPYFFEDGNGQTVTVSGQRYNDMINEFLIPKVNEMNV